MKTTIKGLIKQHIIKVSKYNTAIMRERADLKHKRQFSKKKVEEAAASIRRTLDSGHVEGIMGALAILLDAPELNRTVFQMELLGVIVLEQNIGGHAYPLNVPHLVCKVSPNKLFTSDGNVDSGWSILIGDSPRPATDAEIESCINTLTEKQWNVIMHPSSALFVPLVAEAMMSEVDVLNLGEDTEKQAGDEIETNGRRITIGKE